MFSIHSRIALFRKGKLSSSSGSGTDCSGLAGLAGLGAETGALWGLLLETAVPRLRDCHRNREERPLGGSDRNPGRDALGRQVSSCLLGSPQLDASLGVSRGELDDTFFLSGGGAPLRGFRGHVFNLCLCCLLLPATDTQNRIAHTQRQAESTFRSSVRTRGGGAG